MSGQGGHRKSSVGCLGCFWFFGLVFFSVWIAAGIWWLNPVWFDQHAFWRGEIYGPESSFQAYSAEELADLELPPPSIEERVELWHELAVRADYSPTGGTRLETVEGATFEFPPGSIRDATSIEVVPVSTLPPEMILGSRLLPIGPVHDLRVGGAEHFSFEQGVQVSFPVDADSIPSEFDSGRLALATWENGRWAEIPSRVDQPEATIYATLEHASLIGVVTIIGVAAGGSALKFTQTGQALSRVLSTQLEDVYSTGNFAIHYSASGPLAVPDDGVYPETRGRSPGEHPLYVQDIGAYLEAAMVGLADVGIPSTPGLLLRHDVFLPPIEAFGSSNLGGPIVVDNDFRESDAQGNSGFPATLAYRMRATCAHELVHVNQDDYFTIWNADAARWWIEATAEYLANRFLELRGHPLSDANYYVQGETDLLETPWDLATGLQPYSWARFLVWLEKERGVDTIALVRQVNQSGASLKSIDSALRTAGHGGLGTEFKEYSKCFYHDNLWRGEFADPQEIESKFDRPSPFSTLARVVPGGGSRFITYYEESFPQDHLSATYTSFRATAMQADARAKLVVHLPRMSGGLDDQYALVGGMFGTAYPLSGEPITLTPLAPGGTGDAGAGAHWVSGRLSSTHAEPGDVNQVSLLFGNAAVTRDAPALTVRRWLLMPPPGVVYRRGSATDPYRITWGASDLADKCKHDEFAGYNVYRRRKGDAEFPNAPLNAEPLTELSYTDDPPRGEDHVYTVTVVDSLGNESLPAEAADHDPFQGEWSGKLVLVEGDLVTPVERWFRGVEAEVQSDFQRDLAQAEDAEDRAHLRDANTRVRERDRKIEEAVLPALEKLAALVRLGIPIKLDIALREGKYFARVTEVMLQPVNDDESGEKAWQELVLQDAHTIMPADLPAELSMMVLPLHRKNEINHVWRFPLDTEYGQLIFRIRISLKRE